MSRAELNMLERDVEAARLRLASDLSQLSSPSTLAMFKEDVRHEVTTAAQDGAQGFVGELKARAAANPVATAAIGAGLAWHFIRKPPITTLLVGFGLYSLLKTNPQQPHVGAEFVARAGEAASAAAVRTGELADTLKHQAVSLKHQADEVAGTIRQKAGEYADSASDLAGSVKQQIGDAAESVRRTVGQYADSASELAGTVKQQVGDVAGSVADTLKQQAGTAAGSLRQTAGSLGNGADRAGDIAHAIRDQAGSWSQDIGERANRAVSDASYTARSLANSGSRAVYAAVHDGQERDALLLGAAALAIAAAVGISYQRRSGE